MNPLVTVAIISIMINPMLYPTLSSIETFLARKPALWRLLNRGQQNGAQPDPLPTPSESYRAVVVGYGPIGRTVARLLRDRGIEPTIVEMNIDTFRKLKTEGWQVVYGDASHLEVLETAGIKNASSIILTASGSTRSVEAIGHAKRINPEIHAIVRADFLLQSEFLIRSGVDEVFSGEGEVALAVTDSILRRLGATPDQLEEERERIREDLFRGTATQALKSGS
jgi:CPA2 family monovalent cation:H+ antiporter-2